MACDDRREIGFTERGNYAACSVCGGSEWACQRIVEDQAQRIAELEAENAEFFAEIHVGFAKINLLTDANAALTAQLGAAREIGAEMDAQMPCSTDEIGCPCCCIVFPMVVRLLATLGTAQDGATERAHICGDPNDACDYECLVRAQERLVRASEALKPKGGATDAEVLAKHAKCDEKLCRVQAPTPQYSKLAEECKRADALKAEQDGAEEPSAEPEPATPEVLDLAEALKASMQQKPKSGAKGGGT